VLENLRAVLDAAGSAWPALRTTVYVTDLSLPHA
jgi:hypothetical protein